MRPPVAVVVDPATDAGPGFAARIEGVEEHALVFEAAPQPLYGDVIYPAAAPIHRDRKMSLAGHDATFR